MLRTPEIDTALRVLHREAHFTKLLQELICMVPKNGDLTEKQIDTIKDAERAIKTHHENLNRLNDMTKI